MSRCSSWMALGLALAVTSLGAAAARPSNGLTVHEWGTFTSVAGPDGRAIQWRPLSGPSDLPCFVAVLNPNSLKLAAPYAGALPTIKATVRMETPVLYFYSQQKTNVRATVRFPDGLITEWYPRSSPVSRGIEWSNVDISPGASPAFPVEDAKSHYYAARETDAAPLNVSGQSEKFLFYRGLANFPVPVSATVTPNGIVDVTSSGPSAVRTLVLVESDGTKVGYRVVGNAPSHVTFERSRLTGTIDALRQDLQRVLIEQGLYPREARAMVNTWRDSWFEKGMRVFYFLPQAAVDSILPLRIDPQPSKIVRAFVGRLDIITPGMLTEVDQAIRRHDTATLTQYGRLLEPVAQRILTTPSLHVQASMVQAALRDIEKRYVSPQAACRLGKSCVATP
jgi:hypothetical protein